jgi:hypothetical protein
MPNFNYRKLLGIYRAGVGDRFSDVNKIDNMFIELSRDVVGFNNRIAVLEAIPASVFTSLDFDNNSISGLIIQEETLPGSKITDNSITGDKLVINSLSGLSDANFAPDASISIGKLDLSSLNHGDLLNIGTMTHATLESTISTIGTDLDAAEANIVNAQSAIAVLQTQMGTTTLNTTAQTVTAAINELRADISGYPALPSGQVSVTGTQTMHHLIRATGVDDVLDVAPGIKAITDTGMNGIQSLSSLSLLTDQAAAVSDGSGNVVVSAGSAVSLVGDNNTLVLASEERTRVLVDSVEVIAITSGEVLVDASILPDSASVQVGASGNPWNEVHANNIYADYVYADNIVGPLSLDKTYAESNFTTDCQFWAEISGDNYVSLNTGTWEMEGSIEFSNLAPGSGDPNYTGTSYKWAASNGSNLPSVPANASGTVVLGQFWPGNSQVLHQFPTPVTNDWLITGPFTIAIAADSTPVYLAPYVACSNPEYTYVRTTIRATKIS